MQVLSLFIGLQDHKNQMEINYEQRTIYMAEIPVTEEVYLTYKRDEWREEKQHEVASEIGLSQKWSIREGIANSENLEVS